MLFVFAASSENLFAVSHVFKHSRSSLTFSFIVEKLFEEKDRLVSSTYMLTCECLIEREKSLIKMMKSKGPNQDPCGTVGKLLAYFTALIPVDKV